MRGSLLSIVSAIGSPGDLLRRIRGEYLEMPGLRVTPREAQRLFGLDAAMCDELLDSLLHSGFLVRASDGTFRLAQPGDHAAAAKV
jgi:hypothetical protein